MRPEDYTPDNICRCLGLPGFAADPTLLAAEASLRVLLRPAQTREVCVTLLLSEGNVSVSILYPSSSIWHTQIAPLLARPLPAWDWLIPKSVVGIRHDCQISPDDFSALCANLTEAAKCRRTTGRLVLDGMGATAVLVDHGVEVIQVDDRVGGRFRSAMTELIELVWTSVTDARVRNALADAAQCVRLDLPRMKEPEPTSIARTLILGPEAERGELLHALKQHHEG